MIQIAIRQADPTAADSPLPLSVTRWATGSDSTSSATARSRSMLRVGEHLLVPVAQGGPQFLPAGWV